MIDKNYISKNIQEKFPELLRSSFSINGNVISDFSENILYPFLIYQNTVDSLNRLITIYLPENSNAALLTPFISAVGVYRKALELIMQNQNYKNEVFQNQSKHAVINGNVCSIIQIDYINRLIILLDGKGINHEIPFNHYYELNWKYLDAQDIYGKIIKFNNIDTLSEKDIFTFPLVPEKEHYNGVLLFTNVSKFETLLRTIKISNSDIKEHLKIIKTSFNIDDNSIGVKTISSALTKNKPVSLIVSRSDSYRAFSNIISAGKGDFNHIKTIIIDDFDEIIIKAKKEGTLDEVLDFLQSEYFSKLGNGIKDIFLICSNKNIEIQDIFTKKGINSFPWLLTPVEKLILDDNLWIKPEIIISSICNKEFEEVLDRIYELLPKWKELASSNFCCGKVLLPIRNLYILKEKWISFYNPDNFRKYLSEFERILEQLQDEWFSNKMDYGLIEETKSFIRYIKGAYVNNLLEPDINSLIESLEEKPKLVEIVTKNNDESDNEHIIRHLKKINPGVDFVIKNKNEILLGSRFKEIIPDLIIYLTWDKELFNSSFVNPFSKKQVYLINNTGYEFVKTYSTKINNRIRNIGNSKNKYRLLNIDSDNENIVAPDEELISLRFVECDAKKERIEHTDLIPEIEEFIHDILFEHNNSIGVSNFISNSVMLFFEDGTHVEWPEHKNVFFYDENIESEDASIQKDINDLKIGDQIIVARKSKVLRKVIEDSLAMKESYSKSIKTDHEWRDNILDYLKTNKWDLLFFRKKLNENGFRVESDYTISNWIEGDTIKPHNFTKLLDSLCQMGVLNEVKKTEYYIENKSLKSTKTKFIRSSVQKLLLSLKGINYGNDGFDEALLNNFIDHIEIKRVLGIIKK